MKHKNYVKDTIVCLQVRRIYSFVKEIKLYIFASFIVFLFKSENKNVIKK